MSYGFAIVRNAIWDSVTPHIVTSCHLKYSTSSDFQMAFLRTWLSSKLQLMSTIPWGRCLSKVSRFLHWLWPETPFNSCDISKEKEIWESMTEWSVRISSKWMDFTIWEFLLLYSYPSTISTATYYLWVNGKFHLYKSVFTSKKWIILQNKTIPKTYP